MSIPYFIVWIVAGLSFASSAKLLRQAWLAAHRPIVKAKVSLIDNTPFLKLTLHNHGNREARDVQVLLAEEDLLRASGMAALSFELEELLAAKTVLTPGESVDYPFGICGPMAPEQLNMVRHQTRWKTLTQPLRGRIHYHGDKGRCFSDLVRLTFGAADVNRA